MTHQPKSGIYQILNLTNQKCYVGSSKDIIRRFSWHRGMLKRNKHTNKHLKNAWNKDLENNFVFRILEIVDNPTKDRLEEREDYWIDYYDSMNEGRGYNKQKAQQGSFSEKWKNNCKKDFAIAKTVEYFFNRKSLSHVPEATRRLIAENLFKYSSEGYTTKIDDYSKVLKITLTKEDSKKEVLLQIEPYQVISEEQFKSLQYSIGGSNTPGQKVYQIEPNSSKIIKEFTQFKEVLQTYPEIKLSQLETVLYTNNNKQSAKGMIFVLESKYDQNKIYKIGKSKDVEQIDSKGNVVKVFASPQEIIKNNPTLSYDTLMGILTKTPSTLYPFRYKGSNISILRDSDLKGGCKSNTVYEVDTEGNTIKKFEGIKGVLIEYPELKRKGIEKVLYGELKTYKGKIFKYKKNE